MSSERHVIEYVAYSFIMHLAATLSLLCSPVSHNTSVGGADKIEVNIVERQKTRETMLVPESPTKSLIPRKVKNVLDKAPKGEANPEPGKMGGPPVDLTGYADQLKIIVDPVWYAKLRPMLGSVHIIITTNVLIFLDTYGNVVSVKILKSSGRKDIDKAAIDTFLQIGKLPKPPEALVKEGIIWDFTITPEGM